MSGVTGAVVGGAVIGAAGTAYAAHSASSATKDATNAAIAQQNKTLTQQEALEQPYNQVGLNALPTYQALLGIGPGGGPLTPAQAASQQATLASLPGYQFQKQQGLTATTNAATASGLSLSGNTLKALDDYSTGLADSTYQQELNNVQGAVGIGQAAASGTAANIGTAGSNISNSLINQGNTTAGIDANAAAGLSKLAGNASNQYVTNQTLQDIYGSGSKTPAPVAVTGNGNWDGSATYP